MGSLSLSSSSTDGDFAAALARLDAPNPRLSLDTTLFTPALALESASEYHGTPSTTLDHSNPTTSRSAPVLSLLGRLKKRASALRFAALGRSAKAVDGSDGTKDAHTPRLSLSILTTLGSSAHISRSKQPIAMGASTPCLPSQLHPHTATPSPLASSTSSGSISSCGVHAYGPSSSSSAASSPTKNATIPNSPKPSSRWSTSSNGSNASYRAYPGPRRLDRPRPPSTPALSHPASSAGKVVQLALPNKHKPTGKPQTKPAPGTRPRHAGAIASAPARPAPKAPIPPAPRSQAHPYVYASASSQARVSQRVQVQAKKHNPAYAGHPRSPPRVVRAGAGVLSSGKPKLVVVLPEQKHQPKPLRNTSTGTHIPSPAPLPLLAPAYPLPFPPPQREREREAPRTPPRSYTHPSPRSPYAFAYPRASLGSSPRARCSPRGFVYPASLPMQASPSSLSSGTTGSTSLSTNGSGSDWSDPGMWLASSFEGYTLPSSPSPSSPSSGSATPDSPVVPQAFVPVRRVPYSPHTPHTPLRKPTRPHLPVYAASGVGPGKRYSFGPSLESSPIPSRPLGMEVQESPCSMMSDSTVWHSACSGF